MNMWTLVIRSLTNNQQKTLLVQWEEAERGFGLKSERFQSYIEGLQFTGKGRTSPQRLLTA